jgi:hypothetical protein
MFTSSELRLRVFEKHNQTLKEELLQIKHCYEQMEKDKENSIATLNKKVETANKISE